jgi:hypothetical protein
LWFSGGFPPLPAFGHLRHFCNPWSVSAKLANQSKAPAWFAASAETKNFLMAQRNNDN